MSTALILFLVEDEFCMVPQIISSTKRYFEIQRKRVGGSSGEALAFKAFRIKS